MFACTESEGGTPSSNAGAAGSLSSGGSGGMVADSGGAGGDVGVACPAPASEADAAPPLRADELGFDIGGRVEREGHVSSVAADRIDVAASDGTYTFAWRGPALDTAFAADDAVQIVATDGFGFSSHARISTLRSSSATAVVIAGWPMTRLPVEPGSTATLPDLAPELPDLEYRLVSCCSESSSVEGSTTRCDYSALEATHEGSSAAIPLGDTGVIGAWSITNLHSTYVEHGEHVWEIQVTLLGPATPRSLDGGL
jgi:hypothetical protein